MNKLGRNYRLSIETQLGNTLTIELPFTLEMDITRNTLSSSNVCQIRLYNLSEFNRNQIYFNAYDQTIYRQILLESGYGDNLSTIFTGNISQAWSVRQGVDFITTIECYDGGYAFVNGQVNLSFPAGTPMQVVIEALMAKLPNTKIGAVGNFEGVLARGNTYKGNPAQILFEITGGAFFIDNGVAFALKDNEYVTATLAGKTIPIINVNDQTGLLNTPVLERNVARFEMLFEPSLNVGGLVTILSLTNPHLNGVYKITSVKHRGIISGVVSGALTTTGEFYSDKLLTPVL